MELPSSLERDKSNLAEGLEKLAELDVSRAEVKTSLFVVSELGGYRMGKFRGYLPESHQFTLTGKRLSDGKATDYTVEGDDVLAVIQAARVFNGGPHGVKYEIDGVNVDGALLPGLPH